MGTDNDHSRPSEPEPRRPSEPPPEPRSDDTIPDGTPLDLGGIDESRIAEATRPGIEGGEILYQSYGQSDVGRIREHNEDNFVIIDLARDRRQSLGSDEVCSGRLERPGMVLAVCDGMGGAAAGEVASRMAVDTFYEVLRGAGPFPDRDHFAQALVRATEEASRRIFKAAKGDRSQRGMGTTATLAGLLDAVLFVAQVGDSRAYVLRNGRMRLVTKDQSLVNQLVESGQLTSEEAEGFEHSNIILQALGTSDEVNADLTFLELCRGDRVLVCSDGLSGLVHDDVIESVLLTTSDLREAALQLIALANNAGGHDNITCALVEVGGDGLKPPADAPEPSYQQYPLPFAEETTTRTLRFPSFRARSASSTPPRAGAGASAAPPPSRAAPLAPEGVAKPPPSKA